LQFIFLYIDEMYVFTGCAPPLHSDVYVAGHFNDLAAVAFLPPPRSPAISMREPRSPPLLGHWNDEATPPISLHGEAHPVNTYDEMMVGYAAFKNLNGAIVRVAAPEK